MTRRLAWWQTLIAALLGLGVAIIGSSVVGVVLAGLLVARRGGALSELMNPESLNATMTSLPVLGATLAVTAVGFVGSAVLAPFFARLPVRQTLGLVKAHPATFIAAPIGMLAFGPTSDLLVRLAKRVAPGLTLGSLDMLEQVTREHAFLVLFPLVALLPGFGEELFFRGLIQRTFTRPGLAIAFSAISFSFIHLDPHHVIGVIPLGFYLAWVAHRTGSTWVTIVAHVANNTAALAASQLISPEEEEGTLRETLIAMPIGWAIGAVAIYVIYRFSLPEKADHPDEPVR